MSAKFFELPESDKRRIWAALLAEWQKKKAHLTAGTVNGPSENS